MQVFCTQKEIPLPWDFQKVLHSLDLFNHRFHFQLKFPTLLKITCLTVTHINLECRFYYVCMLLLDSDFKNYWVNLDKNALNYTCHAKEHTWLSIHACRRQRLLLL